MSAIGDADPHAAAELIEPGLRDQLAQHLPIEPQRGRLLGRERTAKLLTELLQAFVIGLAELSCWISVSPILAR